MVRSLSIRVAFLALVSTCIASSAQIAPPAGWTQRATTFGEVLTPAAAPNVSILIHPPEPLGGDDLTAWFSRRANEEMQRAGQPLAQPRITRNSAQAYSMFSHIRDASGQQFTMLYSCVQHADGTAQLVATRIPDSEKDSINYVRMAGIITGQLTRTKASATQAQAATSVTTSAAVAKQVNVVAPEPVPASNGMAVVALLHEGRGTSTPTGFKYLEQIDALFSDGTAYEQLQVPPEVLNVTESRRVEPAKWHHWRKQGTSYAWDKGGAWTQINAELARPLEPGSQLNRHLITRSAVSFGMSGGSVFSKTFVLSSNGSFNRSNSAMHGSGSMQAAAGASASGYGVQDRYGRRSSSGTYGGNGAIATATNTNQPGNGAGDMYGTYSVRGYTLELHTASGATQQLLVCYPFPNSNKIYIAGATYDND